MGIAHRACWVHRALGGRALARCAEVRRSSPAGAGFLGATPGLFGLAAVLLGAGAGLLGVTVSALAGDDLLVSSFIANKVGRYDENSGAYLGELDPSGGLAGAQAIAVGRDGRLYVASEGTDSILRYDLNTFAFVDVFVASASGGLNGPTGVVFDANGDLLVASFETDQILKYSGLDGSFSGIFVAANAGGLDGPDTGMSIGPDGHLYVPSYWNHRVIRFDGQTGAVIDTFIAAGLGGLNRPRTIEHRPDGLWYVTSEANGRVLRYAATGTNPATFHSTFIAAGGLIQPIGITWDKSGFVYVTDGVADTVRKYNAVTGAFIGVFVPAASGGINGPTFVKFVPRPRFTSVQSFSPVSTLSLGWGDADGDGDDDIHVAESGAAPNKLYVNDGAGVFTETNQFGTGTSFVTLLADFDNDGDRDGAMGNNNNQQSQLFINAGGGVFGPQPQFGANRTNAMAWADYDLDGDLDLAVGNGIFASPQQNHLYTNNGDGTFTPSPQFGLFRTITLVWGDYDNDGDPDLAVGNGAYSGTDPNFLYTNNGNGTFTGAPQFGSGQTASMAWGDCDNDGDLDMAVGHWGGGASGISELYINNGDGTFTGRPEFGTRDTNGVNWADFDNDGDLDLVAANGDFTSADQNYIYVNDGAAGVAVGDGPRFIELRQFGLGSTDAVAWADMDSDGDLDAAVGNEHTPPINEVYRNDENDGNGLKLNLVGHRHDKGVGYSNRDAVGALVRVYAPGHVGDAAFLRATRQVEAHGGFTGQNSHDVHVGLPGDASVDIRIRWPGSGGSSITQDLLGVPRGQRLTVHEAAPCYPDCNTSGGLTIADFGCFQTKFVAADPYADCNNSGNLTIADFACFQSAFVAGCP